jgi:hypothetical protein
MERTCQIVIHLIREGILQDAKAMQGAVAKPPRPHQIEGRVVAEGGLHSNQPCAQQGQEMGLDIQATQKQEKLTLHQK